VDKITITGLITFLLVVGGWVLFVYLLAKVNDIYQKNVARERRRLAQLEAENDAAKAPVKKPKQSRPKVSFVEAEAEAEVQAESKGRHVYDPVAHKVVFVPSE
jgi:cell division protein FtsB